MARITKSPFYAVEIVPAIITHTGGVKRNSKSQVLAFDGKPILRLYEVGEMGFIVANIYQNGSFLTGFIVFGQNSSLEAVGTYELGVIRVVND